MLFSSMNQLPWLLLNNQIVDELNGVCDGYSEFNRELSDFLVYLDRRINCHLFCIGD